MSSKHFKFATPLSEQPGISEDFRRFLTDRHNMTSGDVFCGYGEYDHLYRYEPRKTYFFGESFFDHLDDGGDWNDSGFYDDYDRDQADPSDGYDEKNRHSEHTEDEEKFEKYLAEMADKYPPAFSGSSADRLSSGRSKALRYMRLKHGRCVCTCCNTGLGAYEASFSTRKPYRAPKKSWKKSGHTNQWAKHLGPHGQIVALVPGSKRWLFEALASNQL